MFENGPSKSFQGCLLQILLGPLLNTLSRITIIYKRIFAAGRKVTYKLEQLTLFANLDLSNLDLIEKDRYSSKKTLTCG